jgi:hypothetical protein
VQRVESLSARVDFNERRVRGFEQTQHQSRPSGRPLDAPVVSVSSASAPAQPKEDAASTEHVSTDAASEGGRRRRRRRRGRRSGPSRDTGGLPTPAMGGAAVVDQGTEADEFGEDDGIPEDLADDTGDAAPLAAAPAVVEFTQPSPGPEEPAQIAPSESEPVPSSSDASPTPSSLEPTEPSDSVRPEHS